MTPPRPADVLVLIPVFRAPAGFDDTAWAAAHEHLKRYDWATFGPVRNAPRGFARLETPADYWHQGDDGRQGYNPLMLARGLWEQIPARYSHVLVYQLDAIVFRDDLLSFVGPYDYIGAPNLEDIAAGREQQGASLILNGGLSLRRLEAMREILDGLQRWPAVSSYYQHIGCNEDVFWSDRAPRISDQYRVAPLDVALGFAWEADPIYAWLLEERRWPFGAHGYMRHSPEFWAGHGGVRRLAGLPDR